MKTKLLLFFLLLNAVVTAKNPGAVAKDPMGWI